jgi:prevent-host-death family protein
MVIRNISQAKAELSALIAEVLNGNEVILEKAGKPVAKLVPYRVRRDLAFQALWPGISGSRQTSTRFRMT